MTMTNIRKTSTPPDTLYPPVSLYPSNPNISLQFQYTPSTPLYPIQSTNANKNDKRKPKLQTRNTKIINTLINYIDSINNSVKKIPGPDRKYTNQYGSDNRKKEKQEEKGQNRHERGLI